MSVASLVQGYNNISWTKDKLGSCFYSKCENFRHNSQFKTGFSNWSFSPGQNTASLAHSLHLLRPKCPSCINFSMASQLLFSITILVPFKIKPPSIVSSPLNVQYGGRSGGTCLIELGHPCIMVCFNKAGSSSACAWTLSIDLKLSLLAASWWVIWYTWSLGSVIVSFWPPSLDKQLSKLICDTWYITDSKMVWKSSE